LHKHIAIQDKQIDNCKEIIEAQRMETKYLAEDNNRLLEIVAANAEADNERAARAVLDRENPHD
jgi:hypothetical protein